MGKMTPAEEARYALTWGLDRSNLSPVVQAEYDRLGQEDQAEAAAGLPPVKPRAAQDLIPGTRYSRAGLRNLRRLDRAVLVVAACVYVSVAVVNIVSWPANRVLLSGGPLIALCVAPLILCAVCSLGSSIELYGTPDLRRPAGQLSAMYWGAEKRPGWAKLPPAMRRPTARTWFPLLLAAAGWGLVAAGSGRAGMAEGDLRVLPGPRYQVSVIELHNAAWTQVSAAQYHVYLASFVRESSIAMLPALAIIANASYLLFLRRELLAMRSAEPGSSEFVPLASP